MFLVARTRFALGQDYVVRFAGVFRRFLITVPLVVFAGGVAALALSSRDQEILRILVRRVRLLSIDQVARHWWSDTADPISNATRRLRQLAEANLIEMVSLLAGPELDVAEPLAAWQPGLPPPNFDALSYALIKRRSAPVAATTCIVAAPATVRHFRGRAGRFPRAAEVTHDLHLARVYLLMQQALPTRARSWLHEDLFPAERLVAGQKRPDALVTDGNHQTAIESAGEYGPGKLRDFHTYCDDLNLAYELW